MKCELWRDIPKFENYQVSNFGRVRSKDRMVTQKGHKSFYTRVMKGRILSPRKQNGGYLLVWLSDGGNAKPYTIHRLVALAFLGESKLDVNHKDGDKTNNHLENLEWVTRSENILHSYRVLGHKRIKK